MVSTMVRARCSKCVARQHRLTRPLGARSPFCRVRKEVVDVRAELPCVAVHDDPAVELSIESLDPAAMQLLAAAAS